jgi:mono/diheme cytochrome c family protein
MKSQRPILSKRSEDDLESANVLPEHGRTELHRGPAQGAKGRQTYAAIHVLAAAIAGATLSTNAIAQDAARGQELYERTCIGCHGAVSVSGLPAKAANNPAFILAAWQRVPAMNFIASLYGSTDRADIAAYLGMVESMHPTTSPATKPSLIFATLSVSRPANSSYPWRTPKTVPTALPMSRRTHD